MYFTTIKNYCNYIFCHQFMLPNLSLLCPNLSVHAYEFTIIDSFLPVLFLCILLFLIFSKQLTYLRAAILHCTENSKTSISSTNLFFQLHILISTCLETISFIGEGKFELHLEDKCNFIRQRKERKDRILGLQWEKSVADFQTSLQPAELFTTYQLVTLMAACCT